MLFVSRAVLTMQPQPFSRSVSISESRCFSFQVCGEISGQARQLKVSISESRCFSFQGSSYIIGPFRNINGFQSRNRDAFRFKISKSKGEETIESIVSISESRCFSFQVVRVTHHQTPSSSVSISESRCFSFQGYGLSSREYTYEFQSRNRDAFRFKHDCCNGNRNQFQSRNRDAFRFKATTVTNDLFWRFQSRNRDAFRFKTLGSVKLPCRFNLGIEMLFVSS